MPIVDVDLEELRAKRRIQVTLEGEQVLLLYAAETVVAIANECPHLGQSLESAEVCGRTIVCPLHRWRFDLDNGSVAAEWWNPAPARRSGARLRQYRALVASGRIYVERTRAAA